MEKAELLTNLNGLTTRYEQHRQFIAKAQAQTKYPAHVIQKVTADHDVKSALVADEVAPLLPRLREMAAAAEKEKASIIESKSTVQEQIDELELRQAIGELSDSEFETLVTDLRNNAAGANDRIAALEGDLGEINSALERWIALAEPAGHYTLPAAPAAPPAAVAQPSDDEVQYSARGDIRDDVSQIFGNDGPATVRVSEGGDEIAIETSEGNEDAGDVVSAEVHFAAGLGDGGEAGMGGEVEIDIGIVESQAGGASSGDSSPPAREESSGRSGPSIEVVPARENANDAPLEAGARRALLIYQESTAEEQIYPFTNDQLTIGRGRENDIQIKNDSKVSRYHCKLFRRGNNFYVEDIKSSNGTLVNGELITDRRLFGGEEIVIGETYFRFRIME